jgi:[NiFe] hydrogenase assembly HybE family chaperone
MQAPVDKLVAAYRDLIQPRMVGLPMYNPMLEVEAVGFEQHDHLLCGVLVAPWFMNLVLLPTAGFPWSEAAGKNFKVTFPAGEYEFMPSAPEGIEAHFSLPLFTTVEGFNDQGTARSVALDVLRRLYLDTPDPDQADPLDVSHRGMQRPISRRELLFGLVAREGDAA